MTKQIRFIESTAIQELQPANMNRIEKILGKFETDPPSDYDKMDCEYMYFTDISWFLIILFRSLQTLNSDIKYWGEVNPQSGKREGQGNIILFYQNLNLF